MNTKKSVLAVAALLATGAACSQSSVTVFGTMDVVARRVENQAVSRTALASDGRNSSRLGFSGVEDLGGGLAAEFWMEGQLTPDNGNSTGMTWRRRSTVGLRSAAWGEVRLGRDYTPTFFGLAAFDPFGHNGVGLISNVDPHGGVATFVRSDNALSYFLPQIVPGLMAQVMLAPTEGAANAGYQGMRVGYASGPLELRASVGQQYVNKAVNGAKFKTWTAGARYNFGVATLNTNYVNETLEAALAGVAPGTFRHWMVGTVVPFGPHELKASYNQGNKGSDSVRQVAVGYVYNLSKRTALFATVSQLQNRGAFALSVDAGLPDGRTAQVAGGRSRGTEIGITHNF